MFFSITVVSTATRLALYKAEMEGAGFDAAHVARCLDESWVWRNVVVAPTDEEAQRIGIPAFEAMQEHRKALRETIYAEQGIIMKREAVPPARVGIDTGLVVGSPATVAAKMAEIEATGVGGVICSFRLGPMPADVAAGSIRLFMEEVAPRFATTVAAAAE